MTNGSNQIGGGSNRGQARVEQVMRVYPTEVVANPRFDLIPEFAAVEVVEIFATDKRYRLGSIGVVSVLISMLMLMLMLMSTNQ